MTRGFYFEKTIAILALVTIGTGCSTCNYTKKDAGTLDVSQRPLSLSEALTEKEKAQAEGWAEYAKGIYLVKNNPEKAMEHFKNALVLLPDSLKALNAAILPLLEAKELDKALAVLAPIVSQNPQSLHINIIYAHILAELKKRSDAIAHLQKCCEANGFSELRMAIPLVGYLMMEERINEAETVLSRLSKNPQFANNMDFVSEQVVYWHAIHSIVHGSKGNESGEKKAPKLPKNYTAQYCEKMVNTYLEKVLDCEIDTPKQMTIAGDLFSTFNRWDLMWEMLERLKDNEKFSNTLAFITMRLDVLKKRGNKDEYEKYAQSFVENEHVVPALTIKLAQCFQDMKDYNTSIMLVRRLVERMPEKLEFKHWLAQLYISCKQYDAALKLYNDMPKLNANDEFVLSYIWREKGDMEKAYQAIVSSEKNGEGNEKLLDRDFYFSFAIICEKCGKIDEAIEKSRKAYEFDKDNASACNFYGYILADYNRELPFAKALITKALKIEPDNCAYLDSMAWVCYRLKEFKPALEYILKTFAKGGLEEDGDGVIAKHAADICRENGLEDMSANYARLAEVCE